MWVSANILSRVLQITYILPLHNPLTFCTSGKCNSAWKIASYCNTDTETLENRIGLLLCSLSLSRFLLHLATHSYNCLVMVGFSFFVALQYNWGCIACSFICLLIVQCSGKFKPASVKIGNVPWSSPKLMNSQFMIGNTWWTLLKMWDQMKTTSTFMAGLNFKLKTSLPGSRTSHLDACTSIEHAYLSYVHIVLDMSLTHLGQVQAKILCPNPMPMCSLFAIDRVNKD
jgi:hypothetical protein